MVTLGEIAKALLPFGYRVSGKICKDYPIKKGRVDYNCPKSQRRECIQVYGHNQVIRLMCPVPKPLAPKRFADCSLEEVLEQILTDEEFKEWMKNS